MIVVRSSPRIHFESGASVFAVLCFLPMNGAGPSAPEPGDSRGVMTGGTMGSRALGSDIERHEVHGATQTATRVAVVEDNIIWGASLTVANVIPVCQ